MTGSESLPDARQVVDVEARELRVGDDLFGYGIVKSAVWVGGSVRVNDQTGPTLYADEIVTVRR